jgi:transposase
VLAVTRLRRSQGAGSNHKNSEHSEALGRSRGGLTTKIHLAADGHCRPVSRITTPGQRHDSIGFRAVLAGVRIARPAGGPPRIRPDHVLADKAYSSKAIRDYLAGRHIRTTIPEPADQQRNRLRHRRPAPEFDPDRYRRRNVVERCINKLKQHRAVATRYDKRDYMFRGTIDVASIRIWLRDPVP